MIVSEIFEMEFEKILTQKMINDFLQNKSLSVVKYYVASVSKNTAKIFVSFEKKTL